MRYGKLDLDCDPPEEGTGMHMDAGPPFFGGTAELRHYIRETLARAPTNPYYRWRIRQARSWLRWALLAQRHPRQRVAGFDEPVVVLRFRRKRGADAEYETDDIMRTRWRWSLTTRRTFREGRRRRDRVELDLFPTPLRSVQRL
jgi:hypothetical protein